MIDPRALLAGIPLFAAMDPALLEALAGAVRVRHVQRGEVLVREGAVAEALFVVSSGRFEAAVAGRPDPVAEIGPGELIGEIGFFARDRRTASVSAIRDAVVLELARADFEGLAARHPALLEHALAAMAQRLAETTRRLGPRPVKRFLRAAALVPTGRAPVDADFVARLRRRLGDAGRGILVSRADFTRDLGESSVESPAATEWLNRLEREHDLVVLLAEPELTPWTEKALNHADELLLVGRGEDPPPPGPVESRAFALFPPDRRRQVRLHADRSGFVSGTAAWLRGRDPSVIHQVALDGDGDVASLHRILTGRASGLVAGGGGGYGPAHTGIIRAFLEAGVDFDAFGGTSFGAATAVSFAFGVSAEEFTAGLDDIFIRAGAFKRRNIPRYSLLDHTAFDAGLKRLYRDWSMDDAWRPVFAVATDLSENRRAILNRGPVWFAVRASAAIPAVLPPAITESGRLLVDGGVVDNVPLAPMKQLKKGPNLVIHFGLPQRQRFSARYEDIPGRSALLQKLLLPGGRRALPDVPGPAAIIERALTFQQPAAVAFGPEDLVLQPPQFPGSSLLDFSRHREVAEAGYQWALREIDRLAAAGDPALAGLLARG